MAKVLADLVAQLPEEFRPMAQKYGSMILEAAQEDVTEWIGYITEGNWQEAYRFVAMNMTTSDLLDEQTRINERIKSLNKKNAMYIAMQKQMVQDALTIGILLLQAKAGL
jgi:hypothetical protein